jgi:precorrin-8X/cobalt-precorrin-8 methylmutase
MRSRIPDINLTVFSPLQLHEICSDEIERNVYHESLSYIPWVNTSPDEIQHISFSFISRRLRGTYDDPDKRAVVVRVIHATADFDVERIIRFSDSSIASCKEALRAGAPIVTDVGMVSAGIATRFRDRTICAISQPGVQEYAAEKGLTRSAAAMELLKSKLDGAIIAIGNAPTALVQALSIVKTTGIRPSCIVGVPIGFVGAAESHELLMKSDVPWISIKGNRGGSPIAVAIVNAIGSLL